MISEKAFEALKRINFHELYNYEWEVVEDVPVGRFFSQGYWEKHPELCDDELSGQWLAVFLDDDDDTAKYFPTPDNKLFEEGVCSVWLYKM